MLEVFPRPGAKQLCDQQDGQNSKFNNESALFADNRNCAAVDRATSDLNSKADKCNYSSAGRRTMTASQLPPRHDSAQLEFMQSEHAKMLKSLYAEIERLQRRIFELSNPELSLVSIERVTEMQEKIESLTTALGIANDKVESLKKVISVKHDEIESLKRLKYGNEKNMFKRAAESVNFGKPAIARSNKQYEKKIVEKPCTEQLFHRKKVPIIFDGRDQTQKSKNARNVLNQHKSLCEAEDVEQKASEPNVEITSFKPTTVSGITSSSTLTASRQASLSTKSSMVERKTFASTTASTAAAATRKNPIRNVRLTNKDVPNATEQRQNAVESKQKIIPNNQRSKSNLSTNNVKLSK